MSDRRWNLQASDTVSQLALCACRSGLVGGSIQKLFEVRDDPALATPAAGGWLFLGHLPCISRSVVWVQTINDCSTRRTMRASGTAPVVLLSLILLGSTPASLGARTRQWATARRLSQTTADGVQAAAQQIVSFTPEPITGVAAVADQALASPAAVAPAVLPNFGLPISPPPPAPPPPVPVAASEAAWSCGASDVNCKASFELATVGATATFDVVVGAGNTNDMIVVANSTDIRGHVDL